VDYSAVLEERAPRAFCDAAQLALSKFATAQLVCQHLEERHTLLRRDQSDDIFDLVLLLVSQHDGPFSFCLVLLQSLFAERIELGGERHVAGLSLIVVVGTVVAVVTVFAICKGCDVMMATARLNEELYQSSV
jgi:hypothetical protein